MKKFLICFMIGFFLTNCDKSNDDNLEKKGYRPKLFYLSVLIKKDGMFSEKTIENPRNTDRPNPSKYKVVYEELDTVDVKIMHINESISKDIWFKILPYGVDMKKNSELIENHTQRKFRLTLYEEDKVLLSKVITIAAEKWWVYRELKVDNMDCVENLNKDNSAESLTFNLSMKN